MNNSDSFYIKFFWHKFRKKYALGVISAACTEKIFSTLLAQSHKCSSISNINQFAFFEYIWTCFYCRRAVCGNSTCNVFLWHHFHSSQSAILGSPRIIKHSDFDHSPSKNAAFFIDQLCGNLTRLHSHLALKSPRACDRGLHSNNNLFSSHCKRRNHYTCIHKKTNQHYVF